MKLSDLIDRLRTLDREATKGPWEAKHIYTGSLWDRAGGCIATDARPCDMDLAAETRNALPLIIAALEVAGKAMEQEGVPGNCDEAYHDATVATDDAARSFRDLLDAQEAGGA